MLTAYPSVCCDDSTGVMVVLSAEPLRSVAWSILSGDGSVTPLSAATDANGLASAIYKPGTVNTTPIIQVKYGA